MCLQNNESSISIIVPVYNAEATIGKCIESVLSQTYTNWRLILVDDGSQDSSAHICQKYVALDDRIKLIRQLNSGAGAARNRGIDVCQTNWLTFIDADDYIQPGYLDNFKVQSLLEGEISVQGYIRIDQNGTCLGEEKDFSDSYYPQNSITKSFCEENLLDYGQTVGKLYGTDLIRDNSLRFTREFRLSEDHLFFLSVLRYVKGIRTNSGKLYFYQDFQTGKNITSQAIPLKEAFSRFIHIEQAAYELKHQFTNIDKVTLNWLNNFIYTNGISLILQGAYKNKDVKKIDRFEILEYLKKRKDKPLHLFSPKSVKGKVMKQILVSAPSPVVDTIFKFVFNL